MNWIDIVILVILIASVFWGARTGLFGAALYAVGTIIGWIIGGRVAQIIGSAFGDSLSIDTTITVIVYILILGATFLLTRSVIKLLKPGTALVDVATLGMNRIVGMILGLAMGIILVAVLITAITYAATNICIKSLSRTDSPVQITVYGNLLALPLALLPTIFVWKMPSFSDLPWILGLGLLQMLAGLFHAYSVRAADARVVQPSNFLRLPVSVLIAYLLFSELPTPWTWLGAGLIFASSYYVLFKEGAVKKRNPIS